MYRNYIGAGTIQGLTFKYKKSILTNFNAGIIFDYPFAKNISVQLKNEIVHPTQIDDYINLTEHHIIFKNTVRLLKYF